MVPSGTSLPHHEHVTVNKFWRYGKNVPTICGGKGGKKNKEMVTDTLNFF